MRVEQKSFFVGDIQDNQHKKENKAAVFLNNKKSEDNPIEMKRNEAKKQAKKIVDEAVSNEREIDTDLERRAKHIDELRENMSLITTDINEIDKRREELKKTYGIEENSEEQKNLDLLEKGMDSEKIGSDIKLTQEEAEKIDKIKDAGLTEYQERMLNEYGKKQNLESDFEVNKKEEEIEIATIKAIKGERLKTHKVVDATKTAEGIMKAASKEIQGMIMEDAKEHVEEEMEKIKEEAEKKAEELKEQEEKLEELKEKLAQMEELARNQKENPNEESSLPIESVTELLTENDMKKVDVQKEIENIVDKMNLVAEDIKGIMVDSKR